MDPGGQERTGGVHTAALPAGDGGEAGSGQPGRAPAPRGRGAAALQSRSPGHPAPAAEPGLCSGPHGAGQSWRLRAALPPTQAALALCDSSGR